ncbi:CRISPR-associated endonuclease Cas1 [Candidatus Alkanophaga liquidiphilum]
MIERRLRNIVISRFGTSKEGGLIKITTSDGAHVLVSPREVEQIIIAGESSITSGVVRLMLENGVDLVFVEHKPTNFFARVVRSDYNMITALWRKQIAMSKEKRLEIAREIIDCSIYNKIRLLQSVAKNRCVDFEGEIAHLDSMRGALQDADNDGALMGIEGRAARAYFECLRQLFPEEFGFRARSKHPPLDPINSMLSYGYTVLLSRVEYGLMLAGLNPYEGVLHVAYRNRRVLSFDLIEEFRQPIVDRVVITQVGQRKIKVEDFERRPEMCYMKDGTKRNFLDALYRRLEDQYTYKGRRMEFLDIIFEQAKALARAIGDDERYEGFRYR